MAGLTVGMLLKEKGYEIELLEAEAEIGGLCRTDFIDGFVYDIGGGHIIYSRDREILELMLNLLGKSICKHRRNTKIFLKDKYIKYPFENGLSNLSKTENFDCVMGYIEAYIARQVGKVQEPRNFREWIYYNCGRGIAEKFMVPYNEKLWKTDLKEIGIDWIEGRIPEVPLRDIIKSSLGLSTEGYRHQAVFYYPLRGGIQSLINQIANKVEDYIRLRTPVENINKRGKRWFVNGQEYDQVISTIPIYELCDVLENGREIKSVVNKLSYVSLVTFLLGLDEPHPKPYSWVYLPHRSNGYCHRVTYLSNYSPHNAPQGKSSLLVEVTYGERGEPRINKSYIERVVNSLHNNKMIDRKKVDFVEWRKVKYAYPIYGLDYKRNMRLIYDHFNRIGLKLLGRFAEFKYINMDQVIKGAIKLVNEEF